jgi:GH25 family lysozyme M1 (1,4-beta-N-acetylmuramidase)
MKGIDISRYQRDVDYKKLKAAGVDFVIIQAGYGDVLSYPRQKDDMFETHYKAATAAGLHVGAYWYSYATDAKGAKREAQGFIQTIKGKKFDMPIYLDIEEKSQKSNANEICKAFCDVCEAANYWTGVYSYLAMINECISKSICDRYSLWVAQWDVQKCTYNGTVNIWQYADDAYYNGVKGRVDADICYDDYPTKIKNAGKNGYSKPTKVLDTKGMKQGDRNLGVYELKSLLSLAEAKKLISTHITVDDGFGSGTTAVVNELLKKWGYKPNGIAGQGFVKRLTDMLR